MRRMICHCGNEVKARLAWPKNREAKSYNVTWKEEICSPINDRISIQFSNHSVAKWKIVQVNNHDHTKIKELLGLFFFTLFTDRALRFARFTPRVYLQRQRAKSIRSWEIRRTRDELGIHSQWVRRSSLRCEKA